MPARVERALAVLEAAAASGLVRGSELVRLVERLLRAASRARLRLTRGEREALDALRAEP